ncbi:MAG: hypothetical protein WCK33_01395 [Phycisphaerae bacterium]|jgi:hypothetical protein
MSAKWQRVRAADDELFRGPWLWPIKATLRALSSITLAVILLSLVALYGTLASVPIGLLALAPTYLVIGLTLLALVVPVAGLPMFAIHRRTAGRWRTSPLLFASMFILTLALGVLATFAWHRWVWPSLIYDPVRDTGLRLFKAFVARYDAVTIRRLPGFEMSELEFYAWWPLRLVLLAFVANMVVSTVRRIEFTFKNVGVLTVHTGIVVIALGSVYYSGLKREGDTLLFAGQLDPSSGTPLVGPPQNVFFDNTRTAVYIEAGKGWEQRPLAGVPRYNDYDLSAIRGVSAWETARRKAPWLEAPQRPLDLPVADGAPDMYPEIHARIVGYCAFATVHKDWIKAEPAPGRAANPLRIVYMHSSLPDDQGRVSDDPVLAFTLLPGSPTDRVSEQEGVFAIEYTAGADAGMPDERWRDLCEPLPDGTQHALVVEVPGVGGRPSRRSVHPVTVGSVIDVAPTGYRLSVKQLSPTPPFPIITPGYKDAVSSVAVVTVETPGIGEAKGEVFDRYVYHRFPAINQDMVEGVAADGRPKRRNADPAIRIALIDASRLGVYLDDAAAGTRAVVRQKGGEVRVLERLDAGDRLNQIVDKISLSVGDRWAHCREIDRPSPAPAEEVRKDRQAMGTHEKAMLAVEVRLGDAPDAPRERVWLPFSKYFGVGAETERAVEVGGRRVNLAFGRLQHRLPGFAIQLADFKMISYDHRGAPRDYQSTLRVTSMDGAFDSFEHVTQLNAPLTAPYFWNDKAGLLSNVAGRLVAGVDPNQFKFSQAGWDAQGWARSQTQADAGLIKKPFASFTILGVGNSPGIHVIAFGGVLMALGIPWAFYLKPWLVQREKRRIQEQLKAGTFVPPRREAAPATPLPTTPSEPVSTGAPS